MTRLSEISPLWRNTISLVHFFGDYFNISQNYEPTLVNFLYCWANIHWCKGPKIDRIVNSHLVTLQLWNLFDGKMDNFYSPSGETFFDDRAPQILIPDNGMFNKLGLPRDQNLRWEESDSTQKSENMIILLFAKHQFISLDLHEETASKFFAHTNIGRNVGR